MFAIHLSNKDSPSEYIKTLKNQEKNRKWQNSHFTKEDIQMTDKHEKSSISLFIKEMQIKITMGCQHTSTGTAKKSTCWQGCRTTGTLVYYYHFGELFGTKYLYTKKCTHYHPSKWTPNKMLNYAHQRVQIIHNSIKPCSQNWKHNAKCPSTIQWITKRRYSYTMGRVQKWD